MHIFTQNFYKVGILILAIVLANFTVHSQITVTTTWQAEWGISGGPNPAGLDTAALPVPVNRFGSSTIGDLDGDGDQDFISGSYYGTLHYFQNQGTVTNPIWVSSDTIPSLNSIRLGLAVTAGIEVRPDLVDIDSDGDLDLFVGSRWNQAGNSKLDDIHFYRNIGTSTNPIFSKETLPGIQLQQVAEFTSTAFGDLDNDGDLDFVIGGSDDCTYFENIGTSTLPAFSRNDIFPDALWTETSFLAPTLDLEDFDNDGDLDMYFMNESGYLRYIPNNGTATVPNFAPYLSYPAHSFETIDFGKFGSVDFEDLNGDGIKDVIISDFSPVKWYWYSGVSAGPTETFEDETAGQTTFSEDGVNFSLSGNFSVVDYEGGGFGYNGSDFLIDNTGNNVTSGTNRLIGTITSTSHLINTTDCWVYTSQNGVNQSSGTVIFKWYNGSTLLGEKSYSVPSVSPVELPNMGFYQIDFASTEEAYVATKLEIYVVDPLVYVAIDNFSFNASTAISVLSATITVDSNVSCNGFANGGMTVAVSDGTAPYTYAWNNSATTASITGVIAGTYSVTVTDNTGGTATASSAITQPAAIVAATVVDSNTSCNGFYNGGMTASATGGSVPYTYAWNNSATTASITGVSAGTYSVTITDNNGCTSTSSGTVTQPASLVASVAIDSNATCGSANGGATASATGGTGTYTYAWSNAATTASIAGVIAGTYSVTVTDANGCTNSESITITEPTVLVAATAVDNNVTCNGYSDGGATASATGGTGAYTYAWSNSATTASITGVIAGTYSVTITDANGCTDSESVTITESTVLVASTLVDDNVSCNGHADGGATTSATGGTEAYTYAWSNSATTASITGVIAGTYSVTVTDANGCTNSESITITEPTVLVAATAIDNNVTCNGYSDGGATASATGGTGNYSYLWNNSATTASITGVVAGTYTVTITDANGCSDSESITITEPTSLLTTTVLDNNVTCNGYSDGGATASATGGTGNYSYLWNNSATTASITGVVAGTYTVTITDANGCSDSESVTITEPTSLLVTTVLDNNVSCNGYSNGGATASATGGTGNYSYLWSNSATTASITGVVAGTYTVTITDANGCSDSESVTITEPTSLLATTVLDNNVSCNGYSDGGATASATGGTGIYSYLWNNSATTASITGVVAGTYTVTITDANGCSDSESVTITEPTSLLVTTVLDNNVSCNGYSNGGATASATGGTGNYSYLWSNSATTASITGVVAGTYTVTITDANGCSDSESVTITEPTSLLATTVLDNNVSCNGYSDGGATASATGGTGNYSYLWNNSATTASITGVVAGTYTVTITDANGCSVSESVTITEPTSLLATTVLDNNVSCNGYSDGGATASATGGTGIYSYLWNNSATTASITGVVAGTYTVTTTDANGCSDSESVTITEPTSLLATTVLDNNVSCNGYSDGGATASATGGTGNYSYLWSNSATTASITGVVAGTYTVTITDANGCSDSESVTITEPTSLLATTVLDNNVSCNGYSDGGATASATGGTGNYSYLWSNAATTASITELIAGTYSVEITDANGCMNSESIIITEPNVLNIDNVIVTNANGCTSENPSISILTSGGTPTYMYSIDNTTTWQSSNLFEELAAGDYDIYVKDANDCISGWGITIHVNEPAPIVITLDGITNVDCFGNSTGAIAMTVSGGTPDFSYEWIGPDGFTATTESITGLLPGDYVLTVTDANACVEISGPHTVTEPLSALVIDDIMKTNVTICAGNMNASIEIVASGGTPAYLYSIDNGGSYFVNPVFEELGAGVYEILVRDANGCETVLDEVVTITEPDAVTIVAVDVVNVMGCFGDASGEIHIDANGGAGVLRYSIDNGATYEVNDGIFTGLIAGTYQVKVKDMNGCRVLYDVPTVITEPTLLEVAEVIATGVSVCYGNTNGMIQVAALGGTGALLYSIDGGLTYVDNDGMFDGLGAGTYDVFVSDENGCEAEYAANSIVINEPNPMTILVTSADVSTCFGGMDGMISINVSGGTADYFYSIDGGTIWSSSGNFTDLLAGDYDVVIEDASGCMQDYSGNPVVIGEPTVIEFGDVAVTDLGCFGADDGEIMMSGTGGTGMLMFSVDGGMTYQSSGDFTGLSAGEYMLMIKDANGCEMAYENNPVMVEDGVQILIEEVIVTDVQCSGELGSITIIASGGIGELMYSINAGADYFTTNVFTDLISDTYIIRVMDEDGCDKLYDNNPLVIHNSTPSVVTITANPGTAACTGANVELTAEADGAVSYTWSNGETSPSIIVSEMIAGVYDYTCEVVNEGGCESDATISVEFMGGSEVTIMVNPENGPYCVNEPVELEAIADDAVSFTWQPGGLADPIIEVTSDVVQTVEYSVIVINATGCESMASVEIEYDICESLPKLESNMMTIHVYPNPSKGEFSLELTGVSQEVEISVIDFAGKLVQEEKILEITADKMEKQFDLSDYERGVYFLRITHGGKVSYKKVVIQ